MKMYAIAALAALIATPAFAQEMGAQCGPLDSGLKQLADQFHEHIVWDGMSAEGERIITESDDKRTWTELGVKFAGAQAVACVLDSGSDGHVSGKVDSGTVALFVPRGAAKRIEPGRGAM